MDDIQADFLNELEISLREKDRPVSLLNILTYIYTHRTFCIVLLNSAADSGLLEKILSLSLISQKIEEQTSNRYLGYKKDYVNEFVIFGSYSIIRRWLTVENNETPEAITDIILELMERI